MDDIGEADDDDEDGGELHRNILRNDPSLDHPNNQPPQKIPRKGTLRKNIDWTKPVGASALQDNFLSEFDKREAKRKARQDDNEEKLKVLLNWRSPYELYDGSERKINKQKQPFKNILSSNRKEKDESKDKIQSNNKDKHIEKEWEKNDIVHDSSNRRRHFNKPDLLKNLKRPGVSKIINFVAIKSQQSEPDYRPRNKIKNKMEELLPPRPTPREKRKPPKGLSCPKVNQHHFDNEVIEDETLGSLEECDVIDESQANVKLNEHFHEARTTLVETNFHLERTPPIRRSLEFSDYKRNFLTDRLFAGNIYVGSRASESDEEEPGNGTNNATRENDFTSWKDSFIHKMNS